MTSRPGSVASNGAWRSFRRACACVILTTLAWGQGSLPVLAAGAEAHKIMSGDLLRIAITESPDFARDYAVSGDGTASLPLLGRVTLGGLTCVEAAQKIKDALEKDFFKKATVTVEIAQFVSGAIYMQGAVASPTAINVSGDQLITLVEALAQCGGLRDNAAADQVRIFRWKLGAGFQRETMIVNVRDMLSGNDLSKDQFLMPRDIVFVPTVGTSDGGGEFLALGEVGSPGFHAARGKLDVIRAVTAAGGLSREARMDATRLLRPEKNGNYRVIPLDMQKLFGLADMSVNIPVLPGDILFVPSASQASGGQVVFLGELARTGTIPLPLDQPATLARTILSLGGFTKFANENKVKVMRKAPDGSKQTLIVDAGEILKTGAFERDIPLRDEDVIIVPERTIL